MKDKKETKNWVVSTLGESITKLREACDLLDTLRSKDNRDHIDVLQEAIWFTCEEIGNYQVSIRNLWK